MTKWQPIETAPKDGSKFLAFGGGVIEIEIFGWNERIGCWESPSGSLEDWDDQLEGYSRPTHWQPIPEPPTE